MEEDENEEFGGSFDDDDEMFDLSYWHITLPKIDFIYEKNKKVSSFD